jgi:PrgI family protein
MPLKKHKVPRHLEQPDHILFGLTARQTLLLACGSACAGMLWMDNAGGLPATVLTLVLMLAVLLGACAVAFLSPAGRGLETWAIVCLTYLCMPRLYLWRSLGEIEPEERAMARHAVPAVPMSCEEDYETREGDLLCL